MVECCKEIVVGSLRSYLYGIPWVQLSVSELLFILFETVVFLSNWSAFLHYNIADVSISLFGYFCLHGSQLALYRNTGQILFCLCIYLPCSLDMGI